MDPHEKHPNQTDSKRRGRPAGAKSIERRERGETIPSRCPVCGSTSRAPYFATPVIVDCETTRDGQPATHKILRATHCLECGQHRIDVEYRNDRQQK